MHIGGRLFRKCHEREPRRSLGKNDPTAFVTEEKEVMREPVRKLCSRLLSECGTSFLGLAGHIPAMVSVLRH